MSRFARLSAADRGNLRMERPEAPAHIAGLCVVEAGPLLDASGALDLATIRRRLDRRLARAPELRRVVHRSPPLCGAPLWVDDPAFSIDRHVRAVRIEAPGDERSLLEAAERLLRPTLDRSRPLWELWFLTGLQDGRVGALFKIHHAVADGLAAIALIASLLDAEPDAADPPPVAWRPAPPPPAPALLADSTRGKAASVAAVLGHPVRVARGVAAAVADTASAVHQLSAAPRTSLNRPTRGARRFRAVHLDLERARAVAHAHGAKVNDVLLAVVTGGARALLTGRGEPVRGVELQVSVPAALRRDSARQLGNAVGAMVVGLPVGEADPVRSLETIAAASRAAKAAQHPAYVEGLTACLAATGLLVPLIRRQRMINLFVTNVPGPPGALFLLGARIEEILPITLPAGNVTVIIAALSYRGRLDVVVDAVGSGDIDVLVAGMYEAWAALAPGAQDA
ncbi:MAG TPA: wax ester/triacylglycerol synthase family O-acyltransferase [Candidatus Dormibacteraeota bacterium]|nr:wax ester/triacylglycerol synthase family O-acyltransferase [Candidatus Dormibacteraeota bacterium]